MAGAGSALCADPRAHRPLGSCPLQPSNPAAPSRSCRDPLYVLLPQRLQVDPSQRACGSRSPWCDLRPPSPGSFCCGPNRPSYPLRPCPRAAQPGRVSAVLPPHLLGSAICRKTRAPQQPGQLDAFRQVTKPPGICFLSLQPSVGIREPSGPLGAARNGLQTRTGLCDRRGAKRPLPLPPQPGASTVLAAPSHKLQPPPASLHGV